MYVARLCTWCICIIALTDSPSVAEHNYGNIKSSASEGLQMSHELRDKHGNQQVRQPLQPPDQQNRNTDRHPEATQREGTSELKRPMDIVYYDRKWKLNSFYALQIPVYRAPFPTFGIVWPLPKVWLATQRFFTVHVDHLEFRLTNANNYILQAAVDRYRHLIVSRIGLSAYAFSWRHQEIHLPEAQTRMANSLETTNYGTAGTDPSSATHPSGPWDDGKLPQNIRRMDAQTSGFPDGITKIFIDIDSTGFAWPSKDMNESYTIITTNHAIHIHAGETWGGLRALESLSQLLWCTTNRAKVYVNQTYIMDQPRFAHRGLMLDTSRHFINKKTIMLNLEAMSYNKLNVFHWHMVDDQSFPYQSQAFPELSEKGAFSRSAVYTPNDITEIIEFARLRGIRVIPEFDVPGHTRSLSTSRPDVMAKCIQDSGNDLYYGTLNPVSNNTMDFLHTLFIEFLDIFKDEYVHVGGDEVETRCWLLDPEIQQWGKQLHLETPEMMLEYFWKRLQNLITQIGRSDPTLRRKLVMWEDVLEQVTEVNKNVLVHVWKSEPQKFLQAEHNIIYSTCWYLDHLKFPDSWPTFYLCDPTTGQEGVADSTRENQVVGGEACMWAEYQSDDTILQKIWPVVSTVAERLWSPSKINSMSTVGPRLEEQSCRMSLRGVPVQAIMGPSYCERPEINSSICVNRPCIGEHDNHRPVQYSQFFIFTSGSLFGLLFGLFSTRIYKHLGAITNCKLLLPVFGLKRQSFTVRLVISAVILLTTTFILLHNLYSLG